MKKSILILFLSIHISSAKAQLKYDTVMFNNITINNEKLYTKFDHIRKFIDDTKTRARVYTFKEADVPFIYFKPKDIIYTIASHNLVFSYTEEKPDNIYITIVKPNKNLILKLKTNGTSVVFGKKNNLLLLKKFFKNSFNSFQEDKNEFKLFKLVVKNGNRYAFCYLEFNNNLFDSMYLSTG